MIGKSELTVNYNAKITLLLQATKKVNYNATKKVKSNDVNDLPAIMIIISSII